MTSHVGKHETSYTRHICYRSELSVLFIFKSTTRPPVARQPPTAVTELHLYTASVCSTLTHGNEAWNLTPKAMATLNRRSYREEATKPSYELLMAVRTRRHHWLGHILRMPADRLVRRAVLALGQRAVPPYQPGSLLMDTPLPLNELVLRAAEDGHEMADPSPHCRKRGETPQIIIKSTTDAFFYFQLFNSLLYMTTTCAKFC